MVRQHGFSQLGVFALQGVRLLARALRARRDVALTIGLVAKMVNQFVRLAFVIHQYLLLTLALVDEILKLLRLELVVLALLYTLFLHQNLISLMSFFDHSYLLPF